MLVCHVSLRHVRTVAADIVEAADAVIDIVGLKQIAAAIDDNAFARDTVDAYAGLIVREAATASDTVTVASRYAAAIVEQTAAGSSQSATLGGPATIPAAILETANASSLQDRYRPGLWNGRNATLEDPATNLGGVSISSYSATTLAPIIGFSNTAGDSMTLNAGASVLLGAPAPSGFTAGWNPTSATLDGAPSNATLSNGNLTATRTSAGGAAGARSTALINSGKWYIEFKVEAQTPAIGNLVGIITSAGTYTNADSSGTLGSYCYLNNGNIWSNNANTTRTLGTLITGDIIGVAVDFTNQKVWFRRMY